MQDLSDEALSDYAVREQGAAELIEALLYPEVKEALEGENYVADILSVVSDVFAIVYEEQQGSGTQQFVSWRATVERAWEWFESTLEDAFDNLEPDPDDEHQAQRMSSWLSIATLNGAILAASERVEARKVWTTRLDDRVRALHRPLHGHQATLAGTFDVGGHQLLYPGEPKGPPEIWINCRCVLLSIRINVEESMTIADSITADADIEALAGEEPLAPEGEFQAGDPTPWFGTLCVEGIASGDGRKFSEGALTWRELPLPLAWQKQSSDGHEGSVVVGRIDNMERVGSELYADGVFFDSEEADEVVGLITGGGLRGVSVDVDSAEMELNEDADVEDELAALFGGEMVFSKGRVCAATLVAIPAFAEAYIQLGVRGEASSNLEGQAATSKETSLSLEVEAVSEKPWDGSASRFTPEQWKKSCCLHRDSAVEPKSNHSLPIREPGGALSRAGVHAAAGRLGQVSASAEQKAAAKGHLRGAYKQLAEPVPDSLKATADVEEFKRGAGWVTHPKETARLHRYWTKGPGAAKIGWGTPHDFYRCRRQLSKYIPKLYLNRTCAEWHHDALGVWPGRHAGGTETFSTPCGCDDDAPLADESFEVGNAVNLVAAGTVQEESSGFFADPMLDEVTPLVVTETGYVFGHMADWTTCHTGIRKICTTAPHSAHSYAYFRTGTVLTDEGEVPVGQLTVDTGHAEREMSANDAQHHYDHSGYAVADVACGEDDHGIWVAGRVRPSATDDQVAALRAGSLSGDWRTVAGGLELVAALVVNVPGYPIPRIGLAASAGVQISLVAAGHVASSPPPVAADAKVVAREAVAIIDRRARVTAVRATVNADRVTTLVAAVEGG